VVDGPAAVHLGLALGSFPIERLMPEAMALAAALAARAPLSLALAKEHLQHSTGRDLETVLRLEAEAILSLMETEDWREGARAFAENREPEYRGR
jgi:enoyl-CoA hydratase